MSRWVVCCTTTFSLIPRKIRELQWPGNWARFLSLDKPQLVFLCVWSLWDSGPMPITYLASVFVPISCCNLCFFGHTSPKVPSHPQFSLNLMSRASFIHRPCNDSYQSKNGNLSSLTPTPSSNLHLSDWVVAQLYALTSLNSSPIPISSVLTPFLTQRSLFPREWNIVIF